MHLFRELKISFAKNTHTLRSSLFFFAIVLICAVDQPRKNNKTYSSFPTQKSISLMAAGHIGMMIATTTNVKFTFLCNKDINQRFLAAFNGGLVLGLYLLVLLLAQFKSSSFRISKVLCHIQESSVRKWKLKLKFDYYLSSYRDMVSVAQLLLSLDESAVVFTQRQLTQELILQVKQAKSQKKILH